MRYSTISSVLIRDEEYPLSLITVHYLQQGVRGTSVLQEKSKKPTAESVESAEFFLIYFAIFAGLTINYLIERMFAYF